MQTTFAKLEYASAIELMEVKKIIGLLQCERPARRRQDACTTELPGLIFNFH
jgi:hypothetical protein